MSGAAAANASKKRIRLSLINMADKSARNDQEHTYADRENWKESALGDIRALAADKSIAHKLGCRPLHNTNLAETISNMEDSYSSLFLFRCHCEQAEVLVVQLN